jgi:hypothetical protein
LRARDAARTGQVDVGDQAGRHHHNAPEHGTHQVLEGPTPDFGFPEGMFLQALQCVWACRVVSRTAQVLILQACALLTLNQIYRGRLLACAGDRGTSFAPGQSQLSRLRRFQAQLDPVRTLPPDFALAARACLLHRLPPCFRRLDKRKRAGSPLLFCA